MSHLHRGRFIKARNAKTDKAYEAAIAYVEKPLPKAPHEAIGAPARAPRVVKAKAKGKRRG